MDLNNLIITYIINDMKRFLLLIIMPMWLLAAHSQLRINGLTALHDSITNFYLCSIPEDYFGANYDATLDFSELGWTDVSIDGTAVSNGQGR